MWTRQELKADAKIVYKANYWISVLAGVFLMIVTGARSGGSSGRSNSNTDELANLSPEVANAIIIGVVVAILIALIIGAVFSIFVGNVILVGSQKVFINNKVADVKPGAATIFSMFGCGYYKNIVLTMFLSDLYVFLWSLLLIIPGIVKGYEYRMVPYLLADDPSLSKDEAFVKSKEMMAGQKWAAFVLDLSFIGWFILSGLTCGLLAIFYVNPYYYQTCANLYVALNGSSFREEY